MLIAWGFIMMTCGFYRYGRSDAKVAAICALIFAGMYALCNTVVYFTQLTAVANDSLTGQALKILDFREFGLFFSLDLLGYCLMAVSTFFAGLTIKVKDKGDKWLKALLLIHGVFAVSCFIMPTLGLFSADMEGATWIGTLILEFWCVYFIPVGVLAYRYFRSRVGADA
ncbi:MAG: hypothetical protein CVU91_07975 [Firmicutes bacterium HGW-Firmicutes-16]|nr:MAG: hypothetical protein CVU91_07975 [Firmicutes bacterium HGW-Firmicutes-16]